MIGGRRGGGAHRRRRGGGRRSRCEHPLSGSSVEHGLNILPLVGDLFVVVARVQLEVSAPRVKVGRVRVVVLGLRRAVEVKDKFVWREVHIAVGAFDALGPRAVVA